MIAFRHHSGEAGGMRRHLVTVVLLLFGSADAAAQAPSPGAEIEGLLREAYEIVRDQGTGGLSVHFIGNLNRLVEPYGLPALDLPLHALVARGLAHSCSGGSHCDLPRRALRERWLPRLEAFAEDDGAEADTVRAALVELHAGEDPATALEWLDAVRDPELARSAGSRAAARAWAVDLPGAIGLLRASLRPGSARLETPYEAYMVLMRLEEEDLAEALLAEVPSSAIRLGQRLRWVESLVEAGRYGEARTAAFGALERWEPEEDPIMGMGHFGVFVRLDAYDGLIEWARALPDDPAKAAVLVAVATGGGPRGARTPFP